MIPRNLTMDLADLLQDAASTQDDLFVSAALHTIADIYHGPYYWLLKTGHPDPRSHGGPTTIQ